MLEAMAAGLAVVSADAPSARALIDPTATGRLCDAKDVGSFAASVLALCNDRDELRSVGAAARAASSGYDWNAALDSVVETYLDAVPQWRAAAQSGVRRLKQPNAT